MATEGKTVVVTGASQGIGAAIARAFLDRGYRVVANSRRITKSTEYSSGDNLALVDGDIGDDLDLVASPARRAGEEGS